MHVLVCIRRCLHAHTCTHPHAHECVCATHMSLLVTLRRDRGVAMLPRDRGASLLPRDGGVSLPPRDRGVALRPRCGGASLLQRNRGIFVLLIMVSGRNRGVCMPPRDTSVCMPRYDRGVSLLRILRRDRGVSKEGTGRLRAGKGARRGRERWGDWCVGRGCRGMRARAYASVEKAGRRLCCCAFACVRVCVRVRYGFGCGHLMTC